MSTTPFSRRVMVILSLGVLLPSTLLAGLGIYLSLRIADAVHGQSSRYNLYMAQQVSEGFEQRLLANMRHGIAPAEDVVRRNGTPGEIVIALEGGSGLGPARFVPIDELDGLELLLVEHQPVVYAQAAPNGTRFTGLLLRDAGGQVIGAGGWQLEPGAFLVSQLGPLFTEQLPQKERMYGGIESTRGLSVQLIGPDGRERAALTRDPGYARTAYVERLEGPLDGWSVRVAASADAPVVWAQRFVTLLIVFIALMGAVLLGATFFGLRYTVRQLELAQIKSSFVANVTHELRTPIALIHLAVETLMMRRVSSPAETEKFLRTISHEAMRLNQIVDHILDFARLEAGKQVFQFQVMDPSTVVREAVESFRPRLEDQGFRVQVDLPEDLPLVRGDASSLSQCLLNLLDNAMKYSRNRREVRVTAASRSDGDGDARAVAISIQDHGIGISPRDQKRIFEKFVRLETGLVHDVKGTGLGLSLVDQIMRAHGGHIEVESTVGEGSTFILVLPAIRTIAGTRSEPQAQAAS